MASGHINDAPAPEQPPRPPCHFPRLEQFLAREASSLADRAPDAVEQR